MAFIESAMIVTKTSGAYPSDPEGNPTAPPYTNQIVQILTDHPYEQLHRIFKDYETPIRIKANIGTLVAIDIDIIIYDNVIIRPLDYTSSYYRKGLKLMH